MPDEGPSEQPILRAALGLGRDCPAIGQLEQLLDQSDPAPSPLSQHVESCSYCQTELHLMRVFQEGKPPEAEEAAVRSVALQLRQRSAEIFHAGTASPTNREPSWWRSFWNVRWLSPAALAMAGVLIVVAVSVEWRKGPPGLRPPSPEQEVLRSGAIAVIAPVGDLQQAPREIQWQPAPNAVKYQVRLLEVDRTELWKTDTTENRIDLPPQVRALIVPAKTLLCQVSAFDATGRSVAESNVVRFRLLQNVYKP
jgi:hypothetical protein